MGFEPLRLDFNQAGIEVWTQKFELLGWDFVFQMAGFCFCQKAGNWADRLGFGPTGWDLGKQAVN